MTSTVERPSTALNKFEKVKAQKDGLLVKNEIEHFAQIGWENMEEGDLNYRLKWLGIFFRPATPGKFMMRLRLPNGVINSQQLRTLGEIGQRYGDDGAIDITTRQNLQLRGIRINDIPDIFQRMQAVGLTSIQSGMDNVRNITGSPVAGLDRDELFDTRELVQAVQDMITNHGEGNSEFSNLPRKFNIAIAGCRDNSVHAEINDIAFVPAFQHDQFGFNVVVGGFFSAKRCEPAIPLNAWVEPSQVIGLCRAILEVFRDNGLRANRQKSRLMWLIDEWGIEKFRSEVERQLGQVLAPAAAKDEIIWEKRDHIGVFAQKQPGLNYVGLHIPVGRLFAPDLFELSRLAEVYGNGELRLSVEQNVIIPNIPDSRLDLLLSEPLLEKFSINPAPLTRALVSCTGAQFCNFALIETKNRALALIKELDAELELSKPVRFHWTGCPNSCGQPQVADIGLMGTKVRKDGKTVEGVDLFMGGKVGHDAKLGECVQKGIPCEDLKPVLRQLLIDNFGANLKAGVDLSTIPSGNLQVTVVEETKPVTIPASIVLLKSEKIIDCTESDLILDAVEKAGIDLANSCRSGNCATCVQKIVSGKVKYDTDLPALKDLGSDEILTCSATPIGQVVIDA